MRRFEFSDGKSNKFWEIAVEGSTYTVRYGRMGTDGQTSTKVFDSPEKASNEAEKVIGKKTKKGYAEVEAAAPAAKEGENPELQSAILDDPTNERAWAVFADWLQSQGDPRGDLVAVQIARGANPSDATLAKKEAELFEANAKAFLGEFRGEEYAGCHELDWRNGFWQRARIWVDWDHEDVDFTKMLGVLLRHPSAAFLETLELGLADCEGENDYQNSLDSLVKHGIRRGLRKLHVGSFEYPDDTEISWTEAGSFAKCWTILPDLEDLTLTGGGIELGAPNAPRLKRLKLETGGLPRAAAQAVANTSFPALTELEVWFGTENYGGECSAEDARAILANKAGLPRVTTLGLKNADFQNEICGVLSGSALLPQLEHLDLSMGTMTDEGGQVLLDHADDFAHLKSLKLDDNFLTDEMVAKLKEKLPMASLTEQEDPDDWIYVSVGE